MKLSQYTLDLLEDIENRIVPEVEEDFVDQWRTFWNGEITETVFTPKRKLLSKSKIDLQPININDAINDYELMLDAQLSGISEALNDEILPLRMRANYGTGIIPSLFGTELFQMPREQNTLPTVRSFNDTQKIRKIVDEGMPKLNSALGEKVFDFGEMCLEIFRSYPKIAKFVYMYHPDTQGPMDIADLLWGSEMFYELYDNPDLVHALMQLICDTYIAFLDRWFQLYPIHSDLNVHWDFWMRGGICLRNDSAVNISPEQYSEFILQYDTRLLNYFGGGIVHYCGKGDHFIGELASIANVTGFNLSQPHLNDMDKVFDAAFSNGKKMLDLERSASDKYASRPDAMAGMIFSK